VDDTGHARLADFGLSTVSADLGSSGSIKDGHAVRWAAPEILEEERPVSNESDVYSFSMVVIEVWVRGNLSYKPGHSQLQGIYRAGTVPRGCAYHGCCWHFIRKSAVATNASRPEQRSLGDHQTVLASGPATSPRYLEGGSLFAKHHRPPMRSH
jgi:serine/threonine protein kinase